MKLTWYKYPYLNYYAGFEVSYIDNGFLSSRIAVKKVFFVKGLKYQIFYFVDTCIFELRRQTANGYETVRIASEFLKNMPGSIDIVFDLFNKKNG